MKNLILSITLLFFSFFSFGQTTYYAIGNGPLLNAAIWSTSRGGPPAGSIPMAGDDIFTDGFTILITSPTTLRNVFVDDSTANSIVLTQSLTITGTLVGYSLNKWGFGFAGVSYAAVPNIISPSGGSITFTAADVNTADFNLSSNEVIGYWGQACPIAAPIIFDFGANTGRLGQVGTWNLGDFTQIPDSMVFSNNVTLSSGTFEAIPSTVNAIHINGASSSFLISAGSTFNAVIPITKSGDLNSRIFNLTVNGNLNQNSSTYINSENFSVGSNSTFDIKFNGSNQTQGFWYQGSSPSSIAISPGSTINYSANANQNVFAETYGNLTLSGSGTKTVDNSTDLIIEGDLIVQSASVTLNTDLNFQPYIIRGNLTNNGTWEPNQNVRFDGSSAQNISGNNPVVFIGEFQVGNSSTTPASDVTISDPMTFINNMIINTNASLTINQDLTLGGSLQNNGILIESGNETVTFSGSGVVINGTSTSQFANLEITGNVTLNSDINISRDLIVSGNINPGGSTVTFNNTSLRQHITSPNSSTIDLFNLTNDNTFSTAPSLQVEADINLQNTLLLNASTSIDVDGTANDKVFTLVSTSSNTARIGPIGDGGILDGNVTMQRFIASSGAGKKGWRLMTTPIKNQTLNDWNDDFIIQTSFNPTVFDYTEPLGTDANSGVDGWTPLTTLTENISNRAMRAFFFASNFASDVVVDNTGVPFIGNGVNNGNSPGENYTVNLDFTPTAFGGGGWNLITNPYPCEIDWDPGTTITLSPDVDQAIYIWSVDNGVDGNYSSYSGGTGDISQYIASGQSFFVKATGAAGSVTFSENSKNTNNGNTFLKVTQQPNELKINVKDAIGHSDNTYIKYNDQSSLGFDSQWDAYKLSGGWINLSSRPEGDLNLSINTRGKLQSVTANKLEMLPYFFGTYELSFDGLSTFNSKTKFNLVDNHLNTVIPIEPSTTYPFDIIENSPETYDSTRFEIVSIAPLTTFSDSLDAKTGEEILVPIRVKDFKDVNAVRLDITWDKYVFQFKSIESMSVANLSINNFTLISVDEGVLTVDWSNASTVDVPDSTIAFEIRFQIIGYDPTTVVNLNESDTSNVEYLNQYSGNIFGTNGIASLEASKVILGSIQDYESNVIADTKITLVGNQTVTAFGKNDGNYSIVASETGNQDLSVVKSVNEKLNQGVTTFDVIKTKRHLIGLEPFTNNFSLVSADMDLNRSVTVVDVARMQQAALGMDGFVNGKNWLFVNDESDILNDPFGYQEVKSINVTDTFSTSDFTAIKIGDINNNWSAFNTRIDENQILFEIEKIIEENQIIVNIYPSVRRDLSGAQFSLDWDNAQLEYSSIVDKKPTAMTNLNNAAEGKLSFSWYDENGESNAFDHDTPLVSFTFNRTDKYQLNPGINFNDDIAVSVAYDQFFNGLRIEGVEVKIESEENKSNTIQFEVNPNPVNSFTNISFQLVESGSATIKVFNSAGELVFVKEQLFNSGRNNYVWAPNSNLANGIYLIQLETANTQEIAKITVNR